MDIKTEKNPNFVEPLNNEIRKVIPYLSNSINTYNLTLISIVWSFMIIAGGYLSSTNVKWLYLTIFGILFHIITDVLDGAVGRYRNTGAIIWGYFMDHTMDVVITFSISIALALVYPQFQFYILLIIGLQLLLMITAFLSQDKDGLDISICFNSICIGPTDYLILMMCLFLYTIYYKNRMNKYFFIGSIILLITTNIYKIYQKQKKSHLQDLRNMKTHN